MRTAQARIASQSRPVKVRIERSNDINELFTNYDNLSAEIRLYDFDITNQTFTKTTFPADWNIDDILGALVGSKEVKTEKPKTSVKEDKKIENPSTEKTAE